MFSLHRDRDRFGLETSPPLAPAAPVFARCRGTDRIAMVKHSISDRRSFFESDQRWLHHQVFPAMDVADLAGGLSG
jgi:hypothetical protein